MVWVVDFGGDHLAVVCVDEFALDAFWDVDDRSFGDVDDFFLSVVEIAVATAFENDEYLVCSCLLVVCGLARTEVVGVCC